MALAGALVQGGLSMIGSLFGGASAKRAANQQMQLQDRLNENDARRQLGLLQSQNFETWRINEYIREYNADVMANHSTNESENKRIEQSSTNTTGSIDFKRMIADAEAAGFNPVTVLRAGGLAGYSTQNTQFYSDIFESSKSKQARDVMTFLAPPDVPVMGYNGQVQSIQPTNPIGDGINAALQYFNNFDPTKEQRRQLEMGLTKAQIENLNSETKRNLLMQVPSFTGGGRTTGGGFSGFVNSVFGQHSQDSPYSKEGERSVTNPFPTNSGLKVNPNVIDAELGEARYGDNELFSTLMGAYNAYSDLEYNFPAKDFLINPGRVAGEAARNWLLNQYNTLTESWSQSGYGSQSPNNLGADPARGITVQTTTPEQLRQWRAQGLIN